MRLIHIEEGARSIDIQKENTNPNLIELDLKTSKHSKEPQAVEVLKPRDINTSDYKEEGILQYNYDDYENSDSEVSTFRNLRDNLKMNKTNNHIDTETPTNAHLKAGAERLMKIISEKNSQNSKPMLNTTTPNSQFSANVQFENHITKQGKVKTVKFS